MFFCEYCDSLVDKDKEFCSVCNAETKNQIQILGDRICCKDCYWLSISPDDWWCRPKDKRNTKFHPINGIVYLAPKCKEANANGDCKFFKPISEKREKRKLIKYKYKNILTAIGCFLFLIFSLLYIFH